jgi:hypothetical protein
MEQQSLYRFLFLSFFFFAILGFELRAYTLSHAISPFLWWVFSRSGLLNSLPGLASNRDPPDLCLLSSQDYRRMYILVGLGFDLRASPYKAGAVLLEPKKHNFRSHS